MTWMVCDTGYYIDGCGVGVGDFCREREGTRTVRIDAIAYEAVKATRENGLQLEMPFRSFARFYAYHCGPVNRIATVGTETHVFANTFYS